MGTPDAADLTCKEFVELVTNYLEGVLSPVDRRRIDEHLTGCTYCQTYLDQMRVTIRAAGHLPAEAVSPEVLDALLAHFRRWR